MATKRETRDYISFLQQLDALVDVFNRRLSHLPIAGPLNTEQQQDIQFAWDMIDGLRKLVNAERVRLGDHLAAPPSES